MNRLALVPRRIAPITSQARVVLYDEVAPAEELGNAAFYVPPYTVGPEHMPVMAQMPNLQVCQLLTAGYEQAIPHLPSGVVLCNAGGVHDASTAELAVGLMLASLRGIDIAARDMTTGSWNHQRRASLADRRVIVIGAGGVGNAIRERLEAFEAHVTMFGRTARVGVSAMATLEQHLPEADIVVLAVPLDSSTRHLVDAHFLAQLHDGALVVNVSRGPVVHTEALLAETSSGRLIAALDVTDPEPLPAEHPLWTSPGVLITPHLGGDSTAFESRARRLVEAQLERWVAGEPLRYVIAH